MNEAFIDTTILTNILLKTGELQNSAKKSLTRYKKTLLPVYAIKEFKAGPLRNFIYAHNKLATTESFADTIKAFQKLSLTPQKYKTATSLEALYEAESSFAKKTLKEWSVKYGEAAEVDKVQCDEARLALRIRIFIAWRRRRHTFDETVCPLDCYEEVAPFENGKLIQDKPIKCRDGAECAVKSLLLDSKEDLIKIRDAIDPNSSKPEDRNRLKVIKRLIKHPNTELTDKECRHLGDAVFACLAPKKSIILTTNVKDHEPLAKALGKKVESP